MRVALYARVSTDRQEREGTIGSQVEILRQKAATERWQVAMTCLDEGYSGTRLDRPGLDQVRDAAAGHSIDAVVALCPDRLARNYVHQMVVLEELGRFGVSVIFCEGGITDDPHGRLLVQIQAAVAEYERTKIIERNRRGKLFRARQGEVVTGQVPYGYRKLPASADLPPRLEEFKAEADVVRLIFAWHANEGISVRQIAIRLIEQGIPAPKGGRYWSLSTLDRMLRQHAYVGTFYYNRRSFIPREKQVPKHAPGYRPLAQSRPESDWIGVSVPPIIDMDTWTRSQAQHHYNSRFSSRHVGAERYLLRYLVRCGECGQARSAATKDHHNGRIDRYYACRHPLPLHLRPEKLRCTQPATRADELDQLVWNEVVRHLQHPALITQASIARPAGEIECGPKTESPIIELKKQLRRLIDGYQAGAITLEMLQSRQRPLLDRIAELERSRSQADRHAARHADAAARIAAFAQQVGDRLAGMTFTQRQELLRTVLEKVVVTGNRIELSFKIPLPPPPRLEGPSSPRAEPLALRSMGFAVGEVGVEQPALGPPLAARIELPLQQRGQVVAVRGAVGGRLVGELGEAGADGGQAELLGLGTKQCVDRALELALHA